MNTFAILLLCAQACLVQNVYSQCLRGAEILAPAGYAPGFAGAYGLGAPFGLEIATPAFASPLAFGAYEAAYGGEGVGDVAVAGELPVAGTTLVAGQVPIMGAVEFGGIVPAGGEVSITGRCGGACGCRGAYMY